MSQNTPFNTPYYQYCTISPSINRYCGCPKCKRAYNKSKGINDDDRGGPGDDQDENDDDDDDEFGDKAMYQKATVSNKRNGHLASNPSSTTSTAIDEDDVFDVNQQISLSDRPDTMISKPTSASSVKDEENNEMVIPVASAGGGGAGGGRRGSGSGSETDRTKDQDRLVASRDHGDDDGAGNGDGISISYEQSLMMPSPAADEEHFTPHASSSSRASAGDDVVAGASTALATGSAADTSDYKDDDFEKEDEES